MVMIDPALFQSEWFVNLSVDERYMYLYLLVNADCKIGAIEWNERMINFCANCTKKFTKQDIISTYGGRIQTIPKHDNTLIVVDYLRFNWLKNGAELNPHNPLHKSILARLAAFDLTVEKLNEMSKRKIRVMKVDEPKPEAAKEVVPKKIEDIDVSVSRKDISEMFEAFWSAYPSCSRKVDKKHCKMKFEKAVNDGDCDAVSMFNRIMNGLDKWKSSFDWNKNGGQFICAPLVWLNQERWEADVDGNPTETKTEKKPVVVTQKDWMLCYERCANCDGKHCKCGAKTPPMMWERPTAPEECPKFKAR